MNEIDRYVREVLRNLHVPPQDKVRIEDDLRAHLQESVNAGASPGEAIARMGSPAEVADEFMAGIKLHYAGFWRRLGGFAIDILVMLAIGLPLFALSILFANMVPRQPQDFGYVVGGIIIALSLFSFGASAAIFLLYLPILDGRYGQTLGKRLLGMRVLTENGTPIGYKEAFLRWIPYYFDFLFIDALFILFTDMHQRAFDLVARTIVIRELD